MTRRISEPLFCGQDFSSWIAQVEYQGQTRKTRILERKKREKPLIQTFYCIRHKLELKYFHFAQFFPNAHFHFAQFSLNGQSASELTDRQVSGLVFPRFLENTEKTKARAP